MGPRYYSSDDTDDEFRVNLTHTHSRQSSNDFGRPSPSRFTHSGPIYMREPSEDESDSEYTRSRSRRRARSRKPSAAQPPLVINNHIINDVPEDEGRGDRDKGKNQRPAPVQETQPAPPPPPPFQHPYTGPIPPVGHYQLPYPMTGLTPTMPVVPPGQLITRPYTRPRSHSRHYSSGSDSDYMPDRSTRFKMEFEHRRRREQQESLDSLNAEKVRIDAEHRLEQQKAQLESRSRLEVAALKERMHLASTTQELESLKKQIDAQNERDRIERERLEREELNLARRRLQEIEHNREKEEEKQRQAENEKLKRAQEELDEIRRKQELEELRRKNAEEEDYRRTKDRFDEMKRQEEEREKARRYEEAYELRMRKQKEEEERIAEEKEEAEKRAIEKYKQEEAEKKQRQAEEAARIQAEVQQTLQKQLVASGLDTKAIEAIMNGQRVEKHSDSSSDSDSDYHRTPHVNLQTTVMAPVGHGRPPVSQVVDRPTYTRMSRKYVSIESLRAMGMSYFFDQDPEFVVITRDVPETERQMLWKHTKSIRMMREGHHGHDLPSTELPQNEDDSHHYYHHRHRSHSRHHRHNSGSGGYLSSSETKHESSRKKSRARSKSPSMLLYLAGAR